MLCGVTSKDNLWNKYVTLKTTNLASQRYKRQTKVVQTCAEKGYVGGGCMKRWKELLEEGLTLKDLTMDEALDRIK